MLGRGAENPHGVFVGQSGVPSKRLSWIVGESGASLALIRAVETLCVSIVGSRSAGVDYLLINPQGFFGKGSAVQASRFARGAVSRIPEIASDPPRVGSSQGVPSRSGCTSAVCLLERASGRACVSIGRSGRKAESSKARNGSRKGSFPWDSPGGLSRVRGRKVIGEGRSRSGPPGQRSQGCCSGAARDFPGLPRKGQCSGQSAGFPGVGPRKGDCFG